MATETPESLEAKLTSLTSAGHRGHLLARGLARGMIWRDGELPPDSPAFSDLLTPDLLDLGYRVLDVALALLDLTREHSALLDHALGIAGEAIESAVRRGDPDDPNRGFHLTCAAAAFHIGRYSARSYCLLRGDLPELNLSSPEKLVCLLMRRELSRLVDECAAWLTDPEHTDEVLSQRLSRREDTFGAEDALFIALASNFCRAMASFEFGLAHGIPEIIQESLSRLADGLHAAADSGHVSMWWLTRLSEHLFDDLWEQSYHVKLPILPQSENKLWNELRRNFIHLLGSRDLAHIDFWPSQVAAADRAINTADDLVVALPTSSGKTRIAELCILRCLADGKRVVYVTPLRALSAQVELTLAATFRPLGFSTTSVYGASGVAAVDVDTLRSGDIVVATPEKLDFAMRQDPDVISDVGLIVLDEGHMIGLGEREIRYETLVQRLLKRNDADERRIVCLSAIFSPGTAFDAFTDWIRSGQPGDAIRSIWRPTRQRKGELVWHGSAARLDYLVEGQSVFVPRFLESSAAKGRRTKDFPKDRNEFIVAATERFAMDGRTVLIYCPIRGSVETLAEEFLKSHRQGYFESKLAEDRVQQIEHAQRVGREWLGDGHPAVKALRIGLAVHHGQLPRPFLSEVEELLKNRILTIAISSPTLAQGVDLSFEVLIFSSLWRNEGLIPATEFANVVGRVGRAHVDIDGIYVLPVFESAAGTQVRRLSQFRELDSRAKKRQLESGILLLLDALLSFLADKLNIGRDEVAEYVSNNQGSWDAAESEDDQLAKSLKAAISELDNAIFSTVADLDCSAEAIADVVDEAMHNSYWQKRLSTLGEGEQESQTALLRARATWLWRHTDGPKRRGFFSAGVGYAAGELISANARDLGEFLLQGEAAVRDGDVEAGSTAAVGIGSILFQVYPFACKLPERWQEMLRGWIGGVATSEFAAGSEIHFIQNGIVYRLVWAVEAIRTALSTSENLPVGAGNGNFALCLTYGVPTVSAALIQLAGLSSRTLAMTLVSKLQLSFTDNDGLNEWLAEIVAGQVDPQLTGDDQAEWERFVARLTHRSTPRWRERRATFDVHWLGRIPPVGTPLRVRNSPHGRQIDIYSPDLELLGRIKGRAIGRSGRSIGRVSEDGVQLNAWHYGP